VKLYGIKACDTCKKVVKALEAANKPVEFIDIRATPLSSEELSRILESFGSAAINTRSTTWRGMDDIARAAPPLAQLEAHPTLMKRPVIDHDGKLYLGWGKEVQDSLL